MKLIKEIDTFKSPIKFQMKRGFSKIETYHSHEGMEFLFVHEGKGRIIVENKIHDIYSGCMILFQPFQLHQIQLESHEDSRYERTLCIFDPQLIATSLESFPELSKFFHYLWKDRLPQQVIHNPLMELFGHHIREMHTKLQGVRKDVFKEQSILFIHSALQTMYLNWSYEKLDSSPTSHRPTHHVELVMEWVEKNFTANFDLDQLSADLHLSKYHLSHLFREVTGNSITEYIMARRIREACLLLKSTQKSVQEISGQIGLTSLSYFCSLFKKQMGVSPKQYRLK